ncbi:cytochrome c maturation protein CcmE [Varunaivibrio sulfuroxidans]|uniref:Cytochrome c-type biogenesis protein CcmE n=1 Tax=Varunaivibrio sulfuroxidans TaxID=1773489 RepID=A0A4R3JD80_9PROT|nr:cytochrome c maturation protein CcmE [Varunaivibrio sulfuroxidans]TCS63647.1 cytochrome c-type biogenesis protein CcmE [Varunaivibrio sulfuroxidans]WES30214.1 cytochrome c maturation protein CcmE [Varunaivibrio sulfuroxidans]
MKRKHKRLTFVLIGMGLLGLAVGLALSAYRQNIVFFHSPTDVVTKKPPSDRRIRLGGLVEKGSVVKTPGSAVVKFRVTDLANSVPVTFKGLLPDLFREGQGVVTEGHMVNGVLIADEVLAKHDEKYMPPEVADALRKSGKWKEMSTEMKKQAHQGAQ